ncbi:Hypothetical_protein [Hexamita inflata]|uniref:Hypothetical_protein n=2 Tax=Hexamita inflata TaxID=28002 RepID=A0AA86PZF4_9EUKA|nr:Hypothetical protein HINF_LOCUS31630 [Hexamita inflata]
MQQSQTQPESKQISTNQTVNKKNMQQYMQNLLGEQPQPINTYSNKQAVYIKQSPKPKAIPQIEFKSEQPAQIAAPAEEQQTLDTIWFAPKSPSQALDQPEVQPAQPSNIKLTVQKSPFKQIPVNPVPSSPKQQITQETTVTKPDYKPSPPKLLDAELREFPSPTRPLKPTAYMNYFSNSHPQVQTQTSVQLQTNLDEQIHFKQQIKRQQQIIDHLQNLINSDYKRNQKQAPKQPSLAELEDMNVHLKAENALLYKKLADVNKLTVSPAELQIIIQEEKMKNKMELLMKENEDLKIMQEEYELTVEHLEGQIREYQLVFEQLKKREKK